ncbi:hypothetical protein F4604DRAFT_1674280 [Suillus subluteus]|nr:hypothetical protein F4604DRAFT_1674280 [Suillus subluteus]
MEIAQTPDGKWDEEDEEGDYLGVEEPCFLGLERNLFACDHLGFLAIGNQWLVFIIHDRPSFVANSLAYYLDDGQCSLDVQCVAIHATTYFRPSPHTTQWAEFILVGYLADYDHVYPIYIHVLEQIGMLVIPDNGNINHIHNLFATMVKSGAYLWSMNSTHCRPGVKGLALPSWLLPELNQLIQFHHAPFPLGYPPPEHLNVAASCAVETPTFSTSMQFPTGYSLLEHLNFADPVLPHAMEMPTFRTSTPGLDYTDLANSDFNFYDQSTGYSASSVDEHLIPEETNDIQLELVIDMANKTYGEMESQPVIVKISETETFAKSDLGKVLKGAMSAHPDFATKTIQTAISFIQIFNSGDPYQVQQAISDLISHQIFREVLWASLLYPVEGLSDGNGDGRIGDLFPEEIYHILLLSVKDEKKKKKKKKTKTEAEVRNEVEAELEVKLDTDNIDTENILEPAHMNVIIMKTLDHMYDQPHMFPTFLETIRSLPFIMRMNLEDIQPIVIQPIPSNQFGVLPNSGGFSSPKSLRVVWDLPISSFKRK